MEIQRSLPNTAVAEDAFKERLARALCRRVGAGKGMTVKQLAYVVSASEGLVWQWMSGSKLPSGHKLVKLISFFDSSFAHELLSLAGYGVYDLRDQRAADHAKRINGVANAVRAVASILPLVESEPEYEP